MTNLREELQNRDPTRFECGWCTDHVESAFGWICLDKMGQVGGEILVCNRCARPTCFISSPRLQIPSPIPTASSPFHKDSYDEVHRRCFCDWVEYLYQLGRFDAGPKVWSVWSDWFRLEGSTSAHYAMVNGAGHGPISVLSFAECLLGRIGPWHPDSQQLFDAYVERLGR